MYPKNIQGVFMIHSLRWLDKDVFTCPERAVWTIDVENLTAQTLPFTVGLWQMNLNKEGGWNQHELGPHERTQFTCYSKVPAEEGSWGGTLHLEVSQLRGLVEPSPTAVNSVLLQGLAYKTLQNDDCLIPNGQPMELGFNVNYGGHLPVPVCTSNLVFSYIYINRVGNEASKGRMDISLIGPQDCQDWGTVGWLGGTEKRMNTQTFGCTDPSDEGDYKYELRLSKNYDSGRQSRIAEIKQTVLNSEGTKYYEFEFDIDPVPEDTIPIHLSIDVWRKGKRYCILWSPQASRCQKYVTLAHAVVKENAMEECEHQWTMINSEIVCRYCGVHYYSDDHEPNPTPGGNVEITGVKWGYKPYPGQDATTWRPLEHLGSNQGLVPIMVTWINNTDKPTMCEMEALVRRNYTTGILEYIQGNDILVSPGQTQAVMYNLPVVNIPPDMQGEWCILINLRDVSDNIVDIIEHNFTVGTAQEPQEVAVWDFPNAGSYPKHLPDDFTGEVILANQNPPSRVQAVFLYSEEQDKWVFWAKGAPGCKLEKLLGGYDYLVTTIGSCTWEIPLSNEPFEYPTDKDGLRDNLERGQVAHLWWDYDDDYRLFVAKKITQWFSAEEFGEPKKVAYGHPDTGPLFEGDEDSYIEAHCGPEAGLRYALIGGKYQPEDNLWYYTKYKGDYEWRKAKQDKPFGLPVMVCPVNWTQNGKPYGHWVCALQVGEEGDAMEDYVFFQFGDNDIKVPDAQMQIPGNCAVKEVIGFSSYGMPKVGPENVAYWEY